MSIKTFTLIKQHNNWLHWAVSALFCIENEFWENIWIPEWSVNCWNHDLSHLAQRCSWKISIDPQQVILRLMLKVPCWQRLLASYIITKAHYDKANKPRLMKERHARNIKENGGCVFLFGSGIMAVKTKSRFDKWKRFQILATMSDQGWVAPQPTAPPDYFTDSEGESAGGEAIPTRGVYLPPYLPSNRVRPAG